MFGRTLYTLQKADFGLALVLNGRVGSYDHSFVVQIILFMLYEKQRYDDVLRAFLAYEASIDKISPLGMGRVSMEAIHLTIDALFEQVSTLKL